MARLSNGRGKLSSNACVALKLYAESRACHLTFYLRYRNDFSDPQGGKGVCDRKAATIKGDVGRYVNEGNNVINAL